MTANEIFDTAAGWMAQTRTDSDDLAPFVPGMLNVLLEEALPYENALRRFEGKDELAAAPKVTAETMDQPIDYHEVLLQIALPYGLAADFYRDDENYAVMDDFRGRFVTALTESIKAAAEPVEDLY